MPPPATLDQLAAGAAACVHALDAPAGLNGWARQLEDLGFVPGESVRVLRRTGFGADRMVVRVGAGATIALRNVEAACVRLARPQP